MKKRIIKTGVDARDSLALGAKKVRDAIGSTMGPFGGNFYLDKKDAITNDGFKIAAELQYPDELENRGAKAIKEAATKTVDEAGDGTSTAVVLSYEIYKAASKFLDKKDIIGAKPAAQVRKQIFEEMEEVLEKLKSTKTDITSEEDLIKSAIVSTEDEALGSLIGKAQWELGPDGVLIAEDSNDTKCSVEKVKGLHLDNGFGSSGVVTNVEKWQMEVEDCSILLTSFTIKDTDDWMTLKETVLDAAHRSGVNRLVIVARAWTDETINICLQQLHKSPFKIYPLNAPYMDMTERMKDLAAVTGATFYDSESSTLQDIMTSGLGRAKLVIGRRMESVIEGVNDPKLTDAIQKRIDDLKQQRDGSESVFEKATLSKRIAQLENGFAKIKIGSPSNMEKQRLLDKADDAIHAVKAALEEGTIKGAGLATYEIAKDLPDTYILKRPLMAVYEQITSSAPEGFVVEDWVRDPFKVWRVALTHACTAAAALATATGVITEEFAKPLEELFKQQ